MTHWTMDQDPLRPKRSSFRRTNPRPLPRVGDRVTMSNVGELGRIAALVGLLDDGMPCYEIRWGDGDWIYARMDRLVARKD
jgi:hypothetical protein